MNDSELDKLLEATLVPEKAPEFWEAMPRRISAKVHWRQRRSENVNLPSRPWGGEIWGWGFAGAAVLILVGFLLGNWHGNKQVTTLLQNEKLLREVLAMFPNRVRAIVQDERGVNLVLSDAENVPTSTPIYVRICDGKRCSSLVTFSGQEIQIAGQKLTVLSQSDGGIILEGNKFVWSSSVPVYAGRKLKIEAKNLGTITM